MSATIRVQQNKTAVVVESDTVRLLFSYGTLVAAYMAGTYYVSEERYSTTTSKHVAVFVGCTRKEYKERVNIQLVSSHALGRMFFLVMLPRNWEDALSEALTAVYRSDSYHPDTVDGLNRLMYGLLGIKPTFVQAGNGIEREEETLEEPERDVA